MASTTTSLRKDLRDLSRPMEVRELNRQLEWIWKQLLGGLPMKALKADAVEQIVHRTETHISEVVKTDSVDTNELVAALAQMMVAQIAVAKIDYAQIVDLNAHVANIVKANITEASINAAQIDDLSSAVAEIIHAEVATGDFGFAEIKNLLADAFSIAQGIAGSMMITNLAVTSANLLNATIDKLVLTGDDGKYYHVFVGSDGKISTSETTLSDSEIVAGETSDGKQIVDTIVNATSLNGQTVHAQEGVFNTILTQALTAGQITANDAIIASASIPTLYVTSIKSLGDTIDISANQSIAFLVGGIGTVQESVDSLAGSVGAVDAEVDEVRGLILTPDEIKSTVFGSTEHQALSTQVSQTAIGLTITQNTVTDIGGRVENLESGVHVGAGGIDIYKSGSAYRMHIDNAGWAISADGQETIAARESKMFAPRVQVNDALIVGRTAWKASGDGFSRWLKH